MPNSLPDIPFSRIDTSGNEQKYIDKVLKSGWLTTASAAKELENKIQAMIGVRHALAVNSCTSALHLALEALGVGEGDEVLVPSMTFTASAEVIRYQRATPILLDVDFDTRTLNADVVEKALQVNKNVKALIVVHFGGQPAPMLNSVDKEGILSVCKRHKVKVIEDAAHAFPARIGDKMVGTFGDVTCFSFYANKTMTTGGEGGMLLTDDDDIAERAQIMRLHGIDRPVWSRFTEKKSSGWEYDVLAPGFKYNLPDLNASVGLAQLERLEEMRSKRESIAIKYSAALENISIVRPQKLCVPSSDHAWHLYHLVLDVDKEEIRNKLLERLADDGIGTSVHYKPLHRMTYYKSHFSKTNSDLTNSDRIWKGTFSLPIYSLLKENEQDYVIERLSFHLLNL